MAIDYDAQAKKWVRDKPIQIADFIGRPQVWNLFKKIGRNAAVLDLGCGEGYFSRKMAHVAKKVVGVDKSKKMIELAVQQEKIKKAGIKYFIADVRGMPVVKNASINVCVGNFITNYLKHRELFSFYSEIARVLKKGGKFILLMPHPALALVKEYGPVWHYDTKGYDYALSRGKLFKGSLKTMNGDSLRTGIIHSTLSDHFSAISSTRLKATNLVEPVFTTGFVRKHPQFKELKNKVTYLIIIGEK